MHARVADGEHLWLAVAGTRGPLVLARDDGPDVAVETETEVHDRKSLLVAVVPLAAALAADPAERVELRLVHGRRRTPVVADWAERPATPTLEAPTTADGHWQLDVDRDPATGHVVVRRRSAEPGVPVLAVAGGVGDDGAPVVEVRLGAPGVVSVTAGEVTLPVRDGVLVVGEVRDLPWDESLPLEVDGTPLRRTRHVLDRPQHATSLPPLAAPDLELRWLRDGRLALHRREPPVRPLP
ncbi:hypothetical protein [Nocardioides litoris]|uniref:hypothetical protein n=1 Tax=Nocardioides litoris TaxID=1926648 RepID=UPI0011205F02|nr:hypothetical protein [Nocardioides litoris]